MSESSRPTAGDGIEEYRDEEGHAFNYVPVEHAAGDLVVHFSAFFGEWGDAKPYRDTFQGYYHRLKMLGPESEHDWLFACDQYGADENGTYYTGQAGDFFVERAMLALLPAEMRRMGHSLDHVVLMGSSMGATAALKFGLMLGVRGIVAVSPHIDLDICAARQNRERHVAFIVPDGDTQSRDNFRYTRQIAALIQAWNRPEPPPALFIQSCVDDAGVHQEQVLPLVASWRAKGGVVYHDIRPNGGHTSDWATKALLLDAAGSLLAGRPIDVNRYQTDSRFAGSLVRPPISNRLRRRASLMRKWALRRP